MAIFTRITVALLLSAVFAPRADATLLYISEFQLAPTQSSQIVQIAREPSTDQTPVNFGGGATQSSAMQSTTNFVRVWCDVQCSVKFGTNPTATNANTPLSAGVPEYFWVPAGAGYKISVISNP